MVAHVCPFLSLAVHVQGRGSRRSRGGWGGKVAAHASLPCNTHCLTHTHTHTVPFILATFPTIPASFPFLSLPACADLPPPAPTAPPLRPPFPVLLSDHASPDLLQECLLTSATAPRPSEQLLLPLSVQAEEAGKMPGFWVLRSPHPKKLCFLHVSRCRD